MLISLPDELYGVSFTPAALNIIFDASTESVEAYLSQLYIISLIPA